MGSIENPTQTLDHVKPPISTSKGNVTKASRFTLLRLDLSDQMREHADASVL